MYFCGLPQSDGGQQEMERVVGQSQFKIFQSCFYLELRTSEGDLVNFDDAVRFNV
jgi:hypothetical protein